MGSAIIRTAAVGAVVAAVALALPHANVVEPVRAQSAAASPKVTVIPPPDFWGAYAIWGATGADSRGHIWVGITSNDEGADGSAHLYDFDPATTTFVDKGAVVAELARLKVRRPKEVQLKIHSKIVVGADGLQYFASMDEGGENGDGSVYPTWGGHLWRLGATGAWQHLRTTKEALIAVAAGGPYVYALGYFNHVLYQYHTKTGVMKSVAVGSAGGHVSRNFAADTRGHAFVPRITRAANGSPAAALVEYDAELSELAATPLSEYFERGNDDSHGIVGVSPGADGSSLVATGKGRLYQIVPHASGPSTVTDLGWFHPKGSRYVPSMFRDDATGTIYGVAYGSGNGDTKFEWISRTADGKATAALLPYGDKPEFPYAAVLYGSITKDAQGRFYVVGMMNHKPVILQVTAR
jgi:hypothetical protein